MTLTRNFRYSIFFKIKGPQLNPAHTCLSLLAGSSTLGRLIPDLEEEKQSKDDSPCGVSREDSPDGWIVEVPARAGPVQQPEVQSGHAQLLETLPQLRVTPRLAARCHAHEAAPQLGLDKHLHNTLEKIERLFEMVGTACGRASRLQPKLSSASFT